MAGVGDDEAEDLGVVAEDEALGVAEVVAVHLVRERLVAGDGHLGDVGAVVHEAQP